MGSHDRAAARVLTWLRHYGEAHWTTAQIEAVVQALALEIEIRGAERSIRPAHGVGIACDAPDCEVCEARVL